jgi:hypothetical protein
MSVQRSSVGRETGMLRNVVRPSRLQRRRHLAANPILNAQHYNSFQLILGSFNLPLMRFRHTPAMTPLPMG